MANRTMFSAEKGQAPVRKLPPFIDTLEKLADGIKGLLSSVMRLKKVIRDKSGAEAPVIDALAKGADTLNEMKNSLESTASPLNSTGIKYHK